jgi:hypothetical protein
MNRILMNAASLVLVMTLAFPSSGCSDNPVDSTEPSITGSWAGTSNVQGTPVTLSLQMVENGGSVSGNGSLSAVSSVAVSVTGTYNYPALSLTIRSSGFQDTAFSGTLAAGGNAITGSMSGSSTFENFSITLNRQ